MQLSFTIWSVLLPFPAKVKTAQLVDWSTAIRKTSQFSANFAEFGTAVIASVFVSDTTLVLNRATPIDLIFAIAAMINS